MKNTKRLLCTGCTLLCDDVKFDVSGTTISSEVDCVVAQAFIENSNRYLAAGFKTSDNHRADAKAIVDRLQSADAPLIVGLNHLTTEAQQWAWRVADVAGATIDTTLSKANRASIYALQRQGKVTASLGEIANRSDLIVFWFCDPVKTHPRLIERLTRPPAAIQKRILVVGDGNSATAKVADDVIALPESDAADFIRDVRLAIGNQEDAPCTASDEALKLARILTSSNYGSWIYGHTDIVAEQDDVTIASQALVRQLNDHTRFIGLSLRADQNAASGENVLASSSGFPAAVDLSMSIPQYNGPEHAAETVLENGECDFVLLFAGWGTSGEIDKLSPVAKSVLAKTPKAVISSEVPLEMEAEMSVQVDRAGVSDRGEFCRIDDVSLAGGRIVAGNLGSASDLLRLIFAELSAAEQRHPIDD
jgi:formylmethanofuran dehydrogenase subunit B